MSEDKSDISDDDYEPPDLWWTGTLYVIVFLALNGVLFFVVEWLNSNVGHVVGAVLYGVIVLYDTTIPPLLIAGIARVSSIQSGRKREEPSIAAMSMEIWYYFTGKYVSIYAISLSLCMLLSYGLAYWQMCRCLDLLFGGFVSPHTDYWSWAVFAISEIANTASFNAPQILGWYDSPIHATILWAQILNILFNVILAVWFVTVVVQAFRLVRFPGRLSPSKLIRDILAPPLPEP